MRLLATFRKDMILSFRSFYMYIEIIMALIIVAILVFVIPDDTPLQTPVLVHIGIEGQTGDQLLEHLTEETGSIQLTLADSADAVRAGMEEQRDAVGLIVDLKDNKINYTFILQGYESEQVRNILETAFLSSISAALPDYVDRTQTTVLDQAVEKLPTRFDILPVLLILNSAFVGLFIIASYIFMDKEEGTIKAFAVSPARIWEYLLSKAGMMLVTGLITGLITVLAVAGSRVHLLLFLPLMIACNLFGSTLGLLISSFFDSITKSLGALYVAIIVLSLTSVSYFMPSFSPWFIKILPTYPMLFAVRETIVIQPDSAYVLSWSAVFLTASIVLFLLAELRFRRTLTV